MNKLSIVNRMLGSMGERPINSLTNSHRLIGTCLSLIEETNRKLQAPGWWFNTEYSQLFRDAADLRVRLPGDCLSVRTDYPGAAQRGNILYDTLNATDVFPDRAVSVELIRLIDIELTPEVFSVYAMYEATLVFQTQFDADGTRTNQLREASERARGALRDQELRQLRPNLIQMNPGLSRLLGRSRRLNYMGASSYEGSWNY
jgi:Tail tubular protein